MKDNNVSRTTRRRLLKTTGAVPALGLAGCTSGGGSGGDGNGGDGNGGDGSGGDGSGGDGSGGDSGSNQDASVQIGFASGYPDEENYPTGLNTFKEKVESKSDGDIAVTIYPDGQQGSDQELTQSVQTGAMQMGHASMNNVAQFVNALNVKNLPFFIPTAEDSRQLLTSDGWEERIYPEYRNSGFEPLGEWTFDFRHLLVNPGTTENGWMLPEHGDGVKIRVAGSEIEAQAFNEMGANTLNVAWTEAPSSMSEGVFDAIHVSRLAMCSYGFGEWTEYATNPNMLGVQFTYFMNKEFFDGLDQTHKDIIKQAATETHEEARTARDEALGRAEDCYADDGGELKKLSDSQRQNWIDAVGWENEMWDSYVENFGFTRDGLNELTSS